MCARFHGDRINGSEIRQRGGFQNLPPPLTPHPPSFDKLLKIPVQIELIDLINFKLA